VEIFQLESFPQYLPWKNFFPQKLSCFPEVPETYAISIILFFWEVFLLALAHGPESLGFPGGQSRHKA